MGSYINKTEKGIWSCILKCTSAISRLKKLVVKRAAIPSDIIVVHAHVAQCLQHFHLIFPLVWKVISHSKAVGNF